MKEIRRWQAVLTTLLAVGFCEICLVSSTAEPDNKEECNANWLKSDVDSEFQSMLHISFFCSGGGG